MRKDQTSRDIFSGTRLMVLFNVTTFIRDMAEAI